MTTNQPTSEKLRPGGAYIRYSSIMQSESFSLDAQLRQIKARAKRDGIVIVKVYSDEARSAYSKKYRPGIVEMLDDAKLGLFDVLYCHKIDRLARKLEWSIEIAKKLTDNTVALKAVEQNFDLETPEGKLMFHLLASLGEFYSDNLSKETQKGKKERVMQGYHNGQVPWGYTSELVDGRRLAIPIEKLKAIIQEVFERCASGLYYDQEIADLLNEEGYKNRMGNPFTKDGVRGILNNRMYAGYVSYRGTFVKGKSKKANEEFYKGKHEPIISEELYERCQAVRVKRHVTVKTRQTTRHFYLMAGVIACRSCGRKLRAQSTVTGNRYYRETSRYLAKSCRYSGKSIRADLIEPQLDSLVHRLRLPEDWQKTLEALMEENDEAIDIDRESAKIRTEIRRLRKSYTRGLYEGEEHVFWQETETLQIKLKTLEKIPENDVAGAADMLIGLAEAWSAATPDEKQELVKIIFDAIYIDFEKKRITRIKPRPEYNALFQMVDGLEPIKKSLYRCDISLFEEKAS